MKQLVRPLVLVHGLWDNSSLFNNLVKSLQQDENYLFAPNLPHELGKTSLQELANKLDLQIKQRFGTESQLDILGYSMGGLVSRIWLEDLGGVSRCKRFFCVGSPQKGTFTAQLAPKFFFKGISQMKIGSKLISRLNRNPHFLQELECRSFYTNWDLMVFPGWRARLPCGTAETLPVITHKALITNKKSIKKLTKEILMI